MKISKYDTVEHTVNIIKESNLTEMAMDRNKAIAVCMQLGDEFIEHYAVDDWLEFRKEINNEVESKS